LHCVVTYEIAQQRTYEGAYLRTALTQLSFGKHNSNRLYAWILITGLVILKIFGKEFAPIGTLFTVQSVLFTVIALIRSRKVSFIFVHRHDEGEVEYFTSSGEVVLLAGLITMATQVTLMVLLHRTSSE
jgi:hypothetical protein